MQDKPAKEVHPTRRMSLPELQSSQERQPTEEKHSVVRGLGELARGCPLIGEAIWIVNESEIEYEVPYPDVLNDHLNCHGPSDVMHPSLVQDTIPHSVSMSNPQKYHP
jgi:hypothetical protein